MKRTEGTLFTLMGAGSLGLAWLMHTGQLPRNELVGMRTGATTSSDAAWLASHRASAWSVALVGLIWLGAGLWLLRRRPSASAHRKVVLGSCFLVLVVIVLGGIQADRVATTTTSVSKG